MSRLKLFG